MNNINTSFSVSSYCTELLCYLGQELVFEKGSEVLQKCAQVEVNAKMIERICHHYGEEIEEKLYPQEAEKSFSPTQRHYIELDGSMVLTREDAWKEVKLCRIFSEKSSVEISKKRRHISDSQYIAHLGEHTDFLNKVEAYADGIRHKVFLADGAPWIWKWAENTYPEAVQILDFYHAKEHLSHFAKKYISENKRVDWVEEQATKLLENEIDIVCSTLESIKKKAPEIQYFMKNKKRMYYKTYREQGLLIGSGAIESAHRTIIQQRCKLSGQRWTKNGIRQILNLRTACNSNQWNILQKTIKNVA